MANTALGVVNAERSILTDESNSVGANISRNTTTPIAGAADLKLNFPAGTVTFNNSINVVAVNPAGAQGAVRKSTSHAKFWYDKTPTVDMPITTAGTWGVYASTNNKIKIDVNEGTYVMGTGVQYVLNVINDKDWVSANSGAVLARIYDITGGTVLDTLTVNVTTPSIASSASFGTNVAKAAASANNNLYMDDLVHYTTDDSTQKAQWLGRLDTANGTTSANGAYTNGTVIGTTNAFQAVNENPSNGTSTFYWEGAFGQTKKQTVKTWALASKAYFGYVGVNIASETNGQTLPGDIKSIVSLNSTDSLASFTPSTSFSVFPIGADVLPDASAVNTTNLSALEIGMQSAITYTSYNAGFADAGLPASDGAGHPTGWATSSGTARWSLMNDGSDTTYIHTGTVNDTQGMGFSLTTTPIGTLPDVIYKLAVDVRVRTNVDAVGGTGASVTPGVRIGGTDFMCDSASQYLSNPSLTAWTDRTVDLRWSNSFNNPATGTTWLPSDIVGAEWLQRLDTTGGGTAGPGDTFMSNWRISLYNASVPFVTATYLVGIVGTLTSNGAVSGLNTFLPRMNLLGAG